jgi:hypothetical protein
MCDIESSPALHDVKAPAGTAKWLPEDPFLSAGQSKGRRGVE